MAIRVANDSQIIRGQRRSHWKLEAAKALIGSCDAALLYRMVRIAGFEKFRREAGPAFRSEEPGIRFTQVELRWIFDYLDLHLGLEEARSQSNFMKMRRYTMAKNAAEREARGEPLTTAEQDVAADDAASGKNL